jgi:hypothetical protein
LRQWELIVVYFWSNWFPNIVCGIGGCVLSWGIGYWQGRRASITLDNLLELQAGAAGKDVIRDEHGKSTGKLNTTISPGTGQL